MTPSPPELPHAGDPYLNIAVVALHGTASARLHRIATTPSPSSTSLLGERCRSASPTLPLCWRCLGHR